MLVVSVTPEGEGLVPPGQWADTTLLQQITKQKCLAHLAPPVKATMVVKCVSLTEIV